MINKISYQLIKNRKKAMVIATGTALAFAAITFSFSRCTGASASPIAAEQPAVQPVIKVVGLGVNPAVVTSGEVVQVVASINNTGNAEGEYTVDLKINGVTDTTEKVNVPPGSTKDITFQLSRDIVQVYQVKVGELGGQFEVKASQADLSSSVSPAQGTASCCTTSGSGGLATTSASPTSASCCSGASSAVSSPVTVKPSASIATKRSCCQ